MHAYSPCVARPDFFESMFRLLQQIFQQHLSIFSPLGTQHAHWPVRRGATIATFPPADIMWLRLWAQGNSHHLPPPTPRDLLKQFTTMELMRWASLTEDYGKELREGSPDSPATDVFSYSEEGEKRWKDLKNRVVEHVSVTASCRGGNEI